MENKVKTRIRKNEIADITAQKFDCRIDRQVGHFCSEGVGISRQHSCGQIKSEFAVAID